MNIALWGYNDFGRRTSESLFRYWGGRYTVTKIYDPSKIGTHDRFWDIEISDPGLIKADHENGFFEKIIVCVVGKPERDEIIEELNVDGISELFPGDPTDFVSSDDFAAEISNASDGCKIYRCADVLAARADHLAWECLYVFDRDGKILRDPWVVNDWYDPEAPLVYPFPFKDPVPEKIRMPGSYCLLTKIFGNNYWHFTFQNLCDVMFLEKAGFTGTYIIPNAPYDREMMLMIGVAPERIFSIDMLSYHKVYEFDEIWGMQFDHKDTDAEAAAVAQMSCIIRSRLKRDPSYPKYIFVKRIGVRKLLNGDALAEKLGFVTVIPEELSVREQMEYFYNADIVLCPHGANSTNCVYMHEGSVFIEVFSDRWYMDINAKVCLKNHVHHLKAVGKAEGITKLGMHDDYTIPENRILPVLKRAYYLIPDPPLWPEDLSLGIEKADLKSICDCSSGGILIYGAWKLGARAYDMVREVFKEMFLGFAVTSMEGNPEEIDGYPVHDIEDWANLLSDRKIIPEHVVIFISLNPIYYDEIMESLKGKGFKNIFLLEELEWYYFHLHSEQNED